MVVLGIKSKRLESKGCGQSLTAKMRVKGSSWKRMADVCTSKNRLAKLLSETEEKQMQGGLEEVRR